MLRHPQKIVIGNISTSEKELRDIVKAWIIISAAFAILLSGGRIFSVDFYINFIVASLTVGVGFLLHELAHKLVAQRYGCVAEFRAFDQFLWLSLLMSFFGFILAAPGAVMINGPVGVRRNGRISVAGPIVNIILAILFLMLLMTTTSSGILRLIGSYGFIINSWLAVFNMLPFFVFDGKKVWQWNKGVYGLVMGTAIVLMFLQNYF